MRIALAADHAGYVLKDELARWLADLLSQGLAAARQRPSRSWDTMAARMIDACRRTDVPILVGGRGFGPDGRWAAATPSRCSRSTRVASPCGT